ncbi:Cytochrome P450 family ent-kaurenoic acid oxidase [Melia azedarach]|uniref:Cytochrome P450 family ent-kaurenoic acid oxidase n=1 Tax=Melia azedarach TaxID=155640 RepID=A0ACC1YRR3_MELAZ|nr:Cytochrome P450 family ent-kaurenoic acid oxidase [Melia azedarach]
MAFHWQYVVFSRSFQIPHPDSFMNSFITRFGRTGIYKVLMFGNPSAIVTTPETCKRVLTDDDGFKPGWPISTVELIGMKSFVGISHGEHKRLRRLTASPVNGHEAFSESPRIMETLEREYTALNYGVRAMAINLPGFAYHRALKARKSLVAILQSIVDERRNQSKLGEKLGKKKDMMDQLLSVEDENGKKLKDGEIINIILLMYLNAGHESSGHTMMWATIFLQEHPEFLEKAKAEQEWIVKKRPPTQKGLNLKEIREMEYLNKVIDETLRVITFSLTVFREAQKDVNINGYTIPKGWKVLVWFRSVHLDPEIYPNPKEFNPSRWDNFTPKAGSFLPFGGGSSLCPGNDLAKLEIAIFLHHFLLNYRVERLNPKCLLMYLPHSRPKDNCLARLRKSSSSSM